MSRKPASTDHRPAPSIPTFPTSQSPLIGREREVSLSVALLQRPDVRLVTLTGPGGIGKTRLSIAIAARIAHSFAHGARFVSLAALPHASLVAGTIAREFKLAEAADVEPLGTVTATLRDTELLLVLDNFEHVISAAPILNELLGSCPGIKVLVTSRAPLRITGEHVFPVPPLELPERIDTGSLSRITSSPAVQLFVDRARAVDPSFELNGDNAWIIGSICQHVDGLPLAIELAAAQCGVLPPAALLARIEAGMSLPFPGPRDAPDRLRTMRDAISWSYELLTVEEQRLFRCAGVFVGGFGLAAADAVCHTPVGPDSADTSEVHPAHGPGFPPRPNSPDTLDGLAALLDSSLVQQAAWEGEPRFSLLETIRGFAREQLVEQEEYNAVHEAHAEWFLALAEESRWAWLLPGGEQQLRRLEIEHPNLLAALEWLHQHGDHDRLLRMTTMLSGFWYAHTHYREGSMWLQKALESATGASDIARAQANVSLGMLLNLQGHMSEAKDLLDAGLAALKDAGEDVTLALVFVSLGARANFRGEYEEAERLLHDALSLKDSIPDPALATSIQGRALSNLGVAAQGRGDLDLARVQYEHALRLYREHGYILGVIRSLCDRGELASDQGDFAGSLADFQECLSLVGPRGDLRVVVDALEGAALAAAAWHHPEQAAKLLGAAAAIGEQIGASAMIEADRLAHERAMAAVESMLSEQEIRSAWVMGHNLSLAEAITEVQAMSPPGDAGEDIDRSTVRLSAREEEVLRMLVEGYSDRAIAEALFLSVRTVEAHVTRIRIKLGVRSRTAAVTAAIISGLVDPNPSPEE